MVSLDFGSDNFDQIPPSLLNRNGPLLLFACFRNILQLFVNPMIMVAKVSAVGSKPAFGQLKLACYPQTLIPDLD